MSVAPIRFRHGLLPLLGYPRGSGLRQAFSVADGYDLALVSAFRVTIAPRRADASAPWVGSIAADDAFSGRTFTLDFADDALSDDDDELELAAVTAEKNCLWAVDALNADGELEWRLQGDLRFALPYGADGGETAAIGAEISLAITDDVTIAITILGNSAAGSIDGVALAELIHGATEKETIADDDEIAGADSAASYGLKRWKWSTVKAWVNDLIATAIYALNLGDAATKNVGTSAGTVAAGDHLHDDRYYTEGEVDTLLGGKLATSLKGSANGLAELDSGGRVPSAQLPAFVDDVLEVANFAALPGTGESGKIYVTLDTNKNYRWSGSGYTEISESLALGETSGSAYRGDRGKTAYEHSQATGNPHSTTPGDIGAATSTQGAKADSAVQPNSSPTFSGVTTPLVTSTSGASQIWTTGPASADPYRWDISLNGGMVVAVTNGGGVNAIAYSIQGQTFASGTYGNLTIAGDKVLAVLGIQFGQSTVGTLPSASANARHRYEVTDATAPTVGATVSGGGSAKATVRSDGTNWIVIELL